MHEKIEGHGQLENWERPERKIPVSYAFDLTTEILDSEGLAVRRNSMGRIQALTGESIAEGYYRLFGSDGEILKVKNLGLGQWGILAS
jgi:hypothetical protein